MWRFNGYALTCPEGGIWAPVAVEDPVIPLK